MHTPDEVTWLLLTVVLFLKYWWVPTGALALWVTWKIARRK